ncbi:MAG: hypothetical protein KGM96_05510 [Acidobacteriota bacterium]|nr:hypothetical protein [Acidobacteriota bacterium]
MDEQEQRRFIRFLAKEVKSYWRELMAYRLFVEILEESGLPGVQEILETARNSPELQNAFDKHFADFDALLPPADGDFDLEARRLLEHWKPDGEPN